MTKPKKKSQPLKRNRDAVRPGNPYAFKPEAERDALPVAKRDGVTITSAQMLGLTNSQRKECTPLTCATQ